MPARQPFTALCQAVARGPCHGRADLHVHTTASDGDYAPAEVVDLAGRSGLAGVAVTDHDTLDGIPPARAAAAGLPLEVIAGVEITAEYQGRDLHMLGYFIRLDDGPLLAALARLGEHRAGRFWDMAERLRRCGLVLDDGELRAVADSGTLGRRRLAVHLVRTGQAGSVREAFARYLGDGGRATVPNLRLPLAQAVDLVRGAGGVAGWAHPSYDCTRQRLVEFRALGLAAVEVDYPGYRPTRARELRAWAAELGLAVTGGSDCHGPGHAQRAVGARGVSGAELAALRQMASC
ncbi:MAG TPA: PHP domain-containing protein [Gemmataceae bacterium]|jgi:hypothetical protein|nr:PHP domain-containing protein [Gemmataceae bacterium]